MPYELVRRQPGGVVGQRATAEGRLARRTSAALSQLEASTITRTAAVRAESVVQTEKLHEIDHLAREAMSGQALLAQWKNTLAGPDPVLADELAYFARLAQAGKGEVIADTISSYCRESRSTR